MAVFEQLKRLHDNSLSSKKGFGHGFLFFSDCYYSYVKSTIEG